MPMRTNKPKPIGRSTFHARRRILDVALTLLLFSCDSGFAATR